jgi:hypothetical protein
METYYGDLLWTNFLKTRIFATERLKKCGICPQSNRLCGQTLIMPHRGEEVKGAQCLIINPVEKGRLPQNENRAACCASRIKPQKSAKQELFHLKNHKRNRLLASKIETDFTIQTPAEPMVLSAILEEEMDSPAIQKD